MSGKPTYEELEQRTRKLEKVLTGRMRLKADFKGKETFLNDVMNSLSVGVSYTKDRKIVWANEAMEQLFGFKSEEEYLDMDTAELFANREEYDRVGKMLYEQNLNEKIVDYDTTFVRKDGAFFDGYVRVNLIDINNFQKGVIVSVVDITARKQAEENLRKSEEKYRLVMEASPDPVVVYDMEGNVIYLNPAFTNVFGWSPDELQGGKIDYVPDEEWPETRKMLDKMIRGERYQGFETRRFSKTGGIVDISMSFDIWRDQAGKRTGSVVILHDVTERKQAEFALMKSELNYRQIFNGSSDAIFIHDGKTGKIIDVNQQMLTMYGYEKDEVIGLSVDYFSSGIKPYDFEGAEEKIKKTITAGTQIFEWQAKKKDGELFWTEINLRFSKIGAEERILAVVRDITERKRTQEIMIQTERMMSIGGLAAGMAHEINNPLAGMMQTANVMAMRLGGQLDLPKNEKAAEAAGTTIEAIKKFMVSRGIPDMITSITESGRRVADIVSNMLSFARKSEATISSYELADLIDRALELASIDYDLKTHLDFKKIEILKEYENNIPSIPCEGGMIQQVLLNILRNGSHAFREGKTENPRFIVRTRLNERRKMVCMEIEDNGPGMEEDVRKRIFEPFFTTKPVGEGTGLGLSVSYFIIAENHDGEMVVESQPGVGTKFIVRLPFHGKAGAI